MEGPPVFCGPHTAPAAQLHKLPGCPMIFPPNVGFWLILSNVLFYFLYFIIYLLYSYHQKASELKFMV